MNRNKRFVNNRICQLFGISYPIISGGMVWCSGWRLAAAVSNAGGLGLLGAGSMHPEMLLYHINMMKTATDKPWGVNVPLMYPNVEEIIQILIAKHVPIVFTSAGSPKKYTALLKTNGIKVVHVVSSSKFARKCEEAGVDAIVAEGFEAGGHNGREETTTLTLIPQVCQTTNLPVIAAGGIASGQALLATMTLGAEAVQIGTLFALSKESSAAEAFKQACVALNEGDTMLCLKKLAPTRMARNALFEQIEKAENEGATAEQLMAILGEKASKRGIFEGDVVNGELEIGQVAAAINAIESVETIVNRLIQEYLSAIERLNFSLS